MQDRPTAAELLEAVEGFLRKQSAAQSDRWLRFQLLVASNTLGIVRREIGAEEDNVRREWPMLDGLLGVESLPATFHEAEVACRARYAILCDQIRAGEFDAPDREAALVDFLWETTVDRVEITAPGELR
ncbi:MAG: DUF6285 domain-containing protein [Dehalococcoidia bacterium]